ncbi:hypothetical protein [Rhodococcus opacus]|uniref:hypothetical protein n=1 Tax=Rhodococcus opacus TaxID=37919 RepID=UPI002474DD50|nr:hypothetical protein [Rhodococcus opacus]
MPRTTAAVLTGLRAGSSVGAGVRADTGETVEAKTAVSRRDLAYWVDSWIEEPGEYRLHRLLRRQSR